MSEVNLLVLDGLTLVTAVVVCGATFKAEGDSLKVITRSSLGFLRDMHVWTQKLRNSLWNSAGGKRAKQGGSLKPCVET